MRTLNRKLLRDVWRLKSQLLAISLVMACGIGAFIMAVSTSRALSGMLSTYYERYAFAQVFSHLKRAPLSLVDRIREVPGVAAVEARIAADVNLDMPDLPESASGHVVSLPDDADPILNRLHLRRGRLPQTGRRGEAVIGEAFAEAHDLQPGDSFHAIMNGRSELIRIVGVALSPEFVYSIQPGGLVPDDRRYGVLWMRREQLEAPFDLEGAFNDISISLTRGTSEEAVLDAIDALTRPFGGDGAHGRREQVSHRYIDDELAQLRAMASVTPPVFLGVSAVLISIVLSRMIRTQREQIALLKAFGYTSGDIGRHYLAIVLVVGAFGAVAGVVLGAMMGHLLTSLYARFFRFPVLQYWMEPWIAVAGLSATCAAAGLGAAWSVNRAARLPPAEAMRPEAPMRFRRTVMERVLPGGLLPPTAKMIVRHLERHPFRTLGSLVGIALSVAVLTLGSFVSDTVDLLIDLEFAASQRQDLTVTLNEPRADAALMELATLDGVIACEPFRSVPVRLIHGSRSRREALQGMVPTPRLRRLLDKNGRQVVLPPEGLVLSSTLADLLDAEPGSHITVQVMEGQRPVLDLPVQRVVPSYIGTGAYMSLQALNRVLREGHTVSGVMLAIDRNAAARVHAALKQTPAVAAVTSRRAALESFEQTLAENLLRMRLFNLSFALVISIGVVYNSARILLAERIHELATLRVLGFYRKEIAAIFFGQLAAITIAAIPLGMAAGYGLCAVAAEAMQTETHRLPFTVSVQTLAFAGTVVLLAATATALFVRADLDDLDLVETLKART